MSFKVLVSFYLTFTRTNNYLAPGTTSERICFWLTWLF